jgi:predicted PurR-regulated permease PerM
VVGSSVGLPGIWVLFSVIVGGGIGGVLGMILGIPFVSIIYCSIAEYINDKEAIADKVGNSNE